MSIQRLPDNVVGKIKSSSSITSLNGVVCGLVKNSLDAGAHKINIVVDYARGNCTVEDDGLGIAAEEFGPAGGLAKSHCTSRFPPSPHFYGRHGEFLASLAVLSLLILVSKRHQAESHCSLSLNRGTILSREVDTDAARWLEVFTHGTRVSVFDLFGSMPVRVKHRATMFSMPLDLEKEFKNLAYELTALLLAWPAAVSLSLGEARTGRKLRLKCPDGLDLAQKTSRILTQVGLADSSEVASWMPISASTGGVSVQGCISTIPAATKRCQIISFGIHCMTNTLGENVFFDEINDIFASSSFSHVEDADSSSDYKQAPGMAIPKSRRTLEKWPMFYLRFCTDDKVDLAPEDMLSQPSSSLTPVLSLLRAVCYAFLKKNNMRPRKLRHKKPLPSPKRKQRFSSVRGTDDMASPSTWRMTGGHSNPFDNWPRVKVGQRKDTSDFFKSEKTKFSPLVGPGGQLLRKPFFEEPCEDNFTVSKEFQHETAHSNDGVSALPQVTETVGSEEVRSKTSRSVWLDSILKTWENPIFETAEPAVPLLQGGSSDGSIGSNISARISKAALKEAEVIAQVDKKFIMIKLSLATDVHDNPDSYRQKSSALFLVDQHAADERCRLESLMTNYFEETKNGRRAIVEAIDKPIRVDVSAKEAEMLACYKSRMKRWGIVYQIGCQTSEKDEDSASEQVIVTALPPSILERCRGETRLLTELLRKEMWRLEDSALLERGVAEPDMNFQGCPRGILDLLHSRACRSAIMFNDELTMTECSSLIRRLSECSMPFQCAHGRPSMAPLVNLGDSTAELPCTSADIGGFSEGLLAMNDANVWKRYLSQDG